MKTYRSNHKPILSIILVLLTTLGIQVTSYADITPVSDRTRQVHDAILDAVPNAGHADDITDTQLAAITHLNLHNVGITALASGDFSGLTGLTDLNLQGNELRSLPDGIFDGLTALTTLRLGRNLVDPMPITVSLEKVAEGKFRAVVPTGAPFEIEVPVTVTNGSTTDGTTRLTVSQGDRGSDTVTVSRTTGTTDPVSSNIGTLPILPSNHQGYVLSKPETLPLAISSIPEFTDGINTTRTIAENTEADVDIGDAIAATDADSETLTYALSGTDASSFAIDSSSGQLQTSAALDFENQFAYSVIVTVTDPFGSSASINVTINVTDVFETTPLSERTPEIANAILSALNLTDTAEVTDTLMASIAILRASSSDISLLKAGDFDGLSALEELYLESNALASLPADIFDGLTTLETLNLNGNALTSLPADIFDGLTNLDTLNLGNNALTSLPADVFDGLSALEELYIGDNDLTVLSEDIFDGLTTLEFLYLNDNALTSLPEDIFEGLTKLDTLHLSWNDLTSLPEDIFEGLTGLRGLYLSDLTSLHEDIFEGLTTLEFLFLSNNALTSLPEDVFEELTKLLHLDLNNNGFTSLPADIFEGLTDLRHLDLSNNDLTSLPADIFEGLSALTRINARSNKLTSLPAGLFAGLSLLEEVSFPDNDVSPLPMTVSLEKTADGAFKAKVDTGAPFDIVLPVSATNGSIDDDRTDITIPTGNVESSETLTVTRSSQTSDATTVDIGTLPSVDSTSTGLSLAKSSDLPLEVILGSNVPVFTDGTDITRTIVENTEADVDIGDAIAATDADGDTLTYALSGTDASSFAIDSSSGQLQTSAALDFENQSSHSVIVSVSDGNGNNASINVTINITDVFEAKPLTERTPEIANAILSALDLTDTAEVTDTLLASIVILWANSSDISSLKAGDFDGLSALAHLFLADNALTSLPEDVFEGLSALLHLFLENNGLTSLPEDVFDGLTDLRHLYLNGNALTSLPEDVFDGLTDLQHLYLGDNALTSLPEDVFDGLTTLESIGLSDNALTSLPADVFDGLTTLEVLYFNDNDLTSLPADIFEGLSALKEIGAVENDLTSLPAGLFAGLSLLEEVYVHNNDVWPLPMTVSLEKTADGAFKAKVDTGAPFDIVLPVSATNGSIDDDRTDITIPTGNVESSETLTVTRSSQTRDATTVDIGILPSMGSTYIGLSLVKSSNLPLEVILGNKVPVFTDGTATTRTIAENTEADVDIGTAVTATDEDGDTLTYALSGTDASSFAIDSSSGQLQTSAALDFENQSSHSVRVSVSDGNTGNASINVTIIVTDVLETTPLSERTTEVTTTILDAISDVSVATDVTDTHLAAITTLDLSNKSISSLQIGDFSGFTSLETLNLSSNALSSLPADVFKPLGSLVTLNLSDNSLSSLPNGVFSGLTALVTLNLSDNSLSSLPNGVFSGLTALTNIDLRDNTAAPIPLTVSLEKTGTGSFKATMPTGAPFNVALPVSVTNGSISGNATTITISQGYLASDDTLTVRRTAGTLPAVTVDIDPLPSISGTHAGYNFVKSADLPLVVIEKINRNPVFTDGNSTRRNVDENTGRRTNIGNPVAATDANTDDTLTYTLDGTDASAFRIDSQTGQLKTHAALDFETKASYAVRVTVSDGNGGTDRINVTIKVNNVFESTPLSERTTEVVTAIEDAVPGNATGTDITDTHLAAITTLDISDESISSLQIGDFSGLPNLETLNLSSNALSSLPADVFKPLGSLKTLNLSDNSLTGLRQNVFNGLSSLETLNLSDNSISRVQTGLFDLFSGSLKNLNLSDNSMTYASPYALRRLSSLEIVNLSDNSLVSLGSVIFDDLSSLKTLNLSDNSLVLVPSDDPFKRLSALETLNLSDNSITWLRGGLFDDLSALITLDLQNNSVHILNSKTFDGLSSLKTLDLRNNSLEQNDMHDGLFSGLSSLNVLRLSGNTTDPFTFTLSLEKISDGKYKAKLPIGSPYRMEINRDVSDNGSGTWGSRQAILDKGDTETAELRVTRKANSNAAVTVDIRIFTNIPSSHNGYTIVEDENLPIEVIPAVALAPTALPEETVFLANYPNPFNPETWIPYQLAKPADVRLTIYDVRGVAIRTLALGHQPAGFYQTRERAAHWDGRNDLGEKVATGIYFCTFKAGDFTATRKMLIRK